MTDERPRRTLVDTSVIVDIITNDPHWAEWSAGALARAADAGELAINPLIYAEVSCGFPRLEDLDAALPADIYHRESIPWPAAFVASHVYQRHMRGRRAPSLTPFPEFLIGAHAVVSGMTLLTRKVHPYRRLYPTLMLTCPETTVPPGRRGGTTPGRTWT